MRVRSTLIHGPFDKNYYSEWLNHLTPLKKRLTENCITRMGVESLIEALEHNAHVKSIWYVRVIRNTNALVLL